MWLAVIICAFETVQCNASAIIMAELIRTSYVSSTIKNAGPSQGAADLLNLCKGVIAKSVEHMRGAEDSCLIINRHQCDFLVNTLSETQISLTRIHHSSRLDEKTVPVLHHLHQTLLDAGRLVDTSCNPTTVTEWLRAAIEHGDMKETLSRLIYDVKWHMDVLHRILSEEFGASHSRKFEPASCSGRLSAQDEICLLTAKKEDEKVFQERLRAQILDDPLDRDLAAQLQTSSRRFLSPEKLNDYYSCTLLGRGASAEVRQITLFGGEYAMKIFEHLETNSFEQEVAALQGLGHHPNIVNLFWHYKTSSKSFLIMEKMEMDLLTFMGARGSALSGVEAVALMLEIAEGIQFIHSKLMAHRDLKPRNVLINIDQPNLSRIRSVKIADFGLVKTKNVSRTHGDQTLNVGTSRYMAPEIIRGVGDPERGELNSRKADVFSFAIMCAEILSGERAFQGIPKKNNEMKRQVKAGVYRPNLPRECPEPLAGLIQTCWHGDFHQRPDFNRICQELRYIKGLILLGDLQSPSQTELDGIECGFNVEGAGQDAGMAISQATPKSWLVSLFKPPRRLWAFNIPYFLMGLFFLLLLLLSVDVASYHAKQHDEVPSTGGKKGDQFSIVTKGIRQGPWGRDEPKKISGLFDHKANSIKTIFLKYDQTPPGVGLMVVKYANHDGEEFTRRYGNNIIGRKTVKIDFEAGEYIKQISGSVDKYYVSVSRGKVGLVSVVSLTIHSNLRRYGPYGDEVGHRFKSGTGRIIGFFGAAGALLDKLGVWIIPHDDGDESFLILQP